MPETPGFDPTAKAPSDEDQAPPKEENTSTRRGDYTNTEPFSVEKILVGDAIIEKRSYHTDIRVVSGLEEESGEAELELIVHSNTGTSYRINDNLPPDYVILEKNTRFNSVSFISSQRAVIIPQVVNLPQAEQDQLSRYKHVKKEDLVHMPDGSVRFEFLRNPTALLLINHEIGHTKSMELKDPQSIKRELQLRYSVATQGVSKDIEDEYLDTVIREERGAWAFALEEIRKARAAGVDLSGGLDPTEVSEYIHLYLTSYEQNIESFKHPGPIPPG